MMLVIKVSRQASQFSAYQTCPGSKEGLRQGWIVPRIVTTECVIGRPLLYSMDPLDPPQRSCYTAAHLQKRASRRVVQFPLEAKAL